MSKIHIVVNGEQLSKRVTVDELLAIQAGGFSSAIVNAMAKFCVDDNGTEIPFEVARPMLGSLTIEELTSAAEGFNQKLKTPPLPHEREQLEKALRVGTPTAPHWLVVLEAASEWGIPPDQVLKTDVVWFLRWLAVRDVKVKAQKAEAKKQAQKDEARKRHGK